MVYESQHPLVKHKLTLMRNSATKPKKFRELIRELSMLLCYEATTDLTTQPLTVDTPMGRAAGVELQHKVGLVPILRAGLGMLDSILQLIPHARVGFIGLKRDETTLRATAYHKSLPPRLDDFETILIDPMLATGGSTVAAMDLLTERGAQHVRLVNLVAAPEGVRHVRRHYPRVPIFTAAIDARLNSRGYILPGLGDAGDRLFGV